MICRKKFFLLFYFFVLFGCGNSRNDSNNGTQTVSGSQMIHDLLAETVSDEIIPGMNAAIVDSNGIKFIGSEGVRKINSTEQITSDDIFHLGSCTKAMTSTVLATLVANNKIKWETSLIDVFPELENVIHPDYYNVTLHQLVTHRAGIPRDVKDEGVFQDQEIIERRLSVIRENLKQPSGFRKGKYSYSNLGYMIAGSMAERITGQSWDTLIKNRLFKPLGMSSAGFGFPGTQGKIDQPWGHLGINYKWEPLQMANSEVINPAGNVHCSIEDWAKFISLFLTHDNTTILKREQIDMLINPVGNYACGWMVAKRRWADGIALNHNGSNGMWYTKVWVAPEINRAFIVGTNSFDESSDKICDKVIDKLIKIDQEQD